MNLNLFFIGIVESQQHVYFIVHLLSCAQLTLAAGRTVAWVAFVAVSCSE